MAIRAWQRRGQCMRYFDIFARVSGEVVVLATVTCDLYFEEHGRERKPKEAFFFHLSLLCGEPENGLEFDRLIKITLRKL